jgi:hypothetical protein
MTRHFGDRDVAVKPRPSVMGNSSYWNLNLCPGPGMAIHANPIVNGRRCPISAIGELLG